MVRKDSFGTVDGRPVDLYTLTNDHGLIAKITNFGATVVELHTPDRNEDLHDIVLGFDDVRGYAVSGLYLGATVGRVANRIARGRFTIDGVEYHLATNNGPNHLHGGVRGFNKVIWQAEERPTPEGPGVRMRYHSPAGEEGYPGDLDVLIDFTLTHDDELALQMEATTDAATAVNIAHHGYWNLAGHDAGSVFDHELMINADRVTPVDSTYIPTGVFAPVEGTPFDFRVAKRIGRDFAGVARVALDDPAGYDINYIVNGEADVFRLVARVHEPTRGRIMEIRADQPGVQFYSGNFLKGAEVGKGGTRYGINAGFCLETQAFPDSVNHQGEPGWPDVILRPGQIYRHRMVHTFSTDRTIGG